MKTVFNTGAGACLEGAICVPGDGINQHYHRLRTFEPLGHSNYRRMVREDCSLSTQNQLRLGDFEPIDPRGGRMSLFKGVTKIDGRAFVTRDRPP